MQTSWTCPEAAMRRELMILSRPSLRICPSGICEPVKITGFDRFSSINEIADAEYAIVSVPWSTTKPS